MRFKFIAFDLDGVLVAERSSWEWVHKHFGVNNEDGYHLFMEGEIDDMEFMRRDVEKWRSKDPQINTQTITDILKGAKLTKGSIETVRILKEGGVKTGIVSGGIDLIANDIGEQCGIDNIMANGVEADENGSLTGEGICRVPLLNKAKPLLQMLEDAGVQPEECAVIGNSVIDVPMFKVAGFSIAFNPIDEETIREGDVVIHSDDLRDILPYLI